MKRPHSHVSPIALRQMVEEFVTRDGTDHSQIDQRVIDVLEQLKDGRVELHFDSDTNSSNIVVVSD